jgi:hypothetical protein
MVADAAWVTQEFASFLKEVNRFKANAYNAIAGQSQRISN